MRSRAAVLFVTIMVASIGGPWVAPAAPEVTATDVCGPVPTGKARCLAQLSSTLGTSAVDAQGKPLGISPKQLKDIYNFPTSNNAGAGQTISIVIAFDAPNIESDLKKFSKQFGLPPCTTANGCFTKVNQTGGTTYPPSDLGWSIEAAIDVQWVHAVAPAAKILLVEATDNSYGNLFNAVIYANPRARYLSNSWGSVEFPEETLFEPIFHQVPGNSYFFGSGDDGAGPFWPAASPSVVAAGGTSVFFEGDGSFKNEKGWSRSGGGCSQYFNANPAQAAFSQYGQSNCAGKRAYPDVSSVGDPQTGVALVVNGVWETGGGTSLATPIVAARAAVRGGVFDASLIYGNKLNFRDITKGNNGLPCLPGYDLVTGRGSLKG